MQNVNKVAINSIALYLNMIVTMGATLLGTRFVLKALGDMEYGACTVSELCLAKKPTLFVPSPNVAEDHQTKNAMALVDKGAAVMVRDCDAADCGISTALKLVSDKAKLEKLSKNIAKLATPDAAARVVDEILKQIKE